MTTSEEYLERERRARDRAEGIVLRRRQQQEVDRENERRRNDRSGFDIAAALELLLDEAPTRRAMLALLESWLNEAKNSGPTEHDEGYVQGVEHAIEVMKTSPDPLTAIAILQRQET